MPPLECIRVELPAEIPSVQFPAEALEVPVHDRPHVGFDDRRRCALVFADRWDDLRGERPVQQGEWLGEEDSSLGHRMSVRVGLTGN